MLSLLALVGATCVGSLPVDYPTIPMEGASGKVRMPMMGIGTWQYNNTVARQVVATAFGLGYRHVDTALLYKNHVGVGQALRESGLKREEYFVTTKIPGGLNESATTADADRCLAELELDYVDLLLLHFPVSIDGKGGPAMRKEQWLALERWAKAGKARAIGVSHYCRSQLEDVLSVSSVPVALNQVEYHIGMGSAGDDATDYQEFCRTKSIVYMSFSTLCGPCPPPDNTMLLTGGLTTEIGKAHNKSGSQVALRWAVQQGIPVIPKSHVTEHVRDNFEIFDFELTPQEMQRLSAAKEPAVAGSGDGKTSGDCPLPQEMLI